MCVILYSVIDIFFANHFINKSLILYKNFIKIFERGCNLNMQQVYGSDPHKANKNY